MFLSIKQPREVLDCVSFGIHYLQLSHLCTLVTEDTSGMQSRNLTAVVNCELKDYSSAHIFFFLGIQYVRIILI